MAQIIGNIQEKGGTGKSTVATNLSGMVTERRTTIGELIEELMEQHL